MAYILNAVGDDVVGIEFRMTLHGPIGIERHAYHVELATVFQDCVKVVVIETLTMPPVQVYNDNGIGENLLHSIVTGTDEPCILPRLGLDMTHAVRDDGIPQRVLDLPAALVGLHAPQHAVGGLVAHLHPTGLDAVCF